MLVMAAGSLLTALTGFLVSSYAKKKWYAGWDERGFSELNKSWSKLFFISTAIGVLVSAISGFISESILISFLFGGITFVLAFTGFVDFKLKLAPREITTFGIIFAVAVSAAAMISGNRYLGDTFTGSLLQDSLIQVVMWTVMVGLFLLLIVLIQPGGMGFADYKIMWMVGFAFAWLVGFVPVGIMFTAGVILQGAGFIVAAIKKSGNKALPLIPALSISYIVGSVLYLSSLT